MLLVCPSCGRNDFDPQKQCLCGYSADHNFITEAFLDEITKESNKEPENKESINMAQPKQDLNNEGNIIKVIDAWQFTFSKEEDCISIGTPALQSFRLKLTIEDLEELLEFMYQQSGNEKTIRNLSLSAEDMPDFIYKINALIEEKKSKIPIEFASNELQEIVDTLNVKLKA